MNYLVGSPRPIHSAPSEDRILVDARLVKSHRRYLGTPPRNLRLRVPIEIAKSVVFIGRVRETIDPDNRDKLAGTGFAVAFSSGTDLTHHYLVTARHVVKKI